jgi:type IV secretory pathway VirB4 component|tara:strand:- start:69 stop:521 length:453 start_codon:yes stop_codon:yes gene_type:complete
MAYSVQKTKWSQNNPTERINTNEQAGRVRVAYATYEASAEQATIEMFNLPNNARIVSGWLGHDALGSSTTLSVGYAAHKTAAGATVALDVDEYKAAAASTADQVVQICATMALQAFNETDADATGVPVTVTLAGANGTGTISLLMEYVVD